MTDRTPVDTVRIDAEQKLQANPHFLNRDIRCDFHEGVLILRGRVRSYYHKQIAQTIAAAVQGVGQVINHIEVGE
ncbi:MAG: BON domain-containing protein [Planctomycetaceae bacterium]